jgi:hypothetical protein
LSDGGPVLMVMGLHLGGDPVAEQCSGDASVYAALMSG